MIDRRESRYRLACTLDIYSNALMGNLQRFIELGDRSGAEMIWTCCVSCLGHLTALSHLISQREPALRESMEGLLDLTLNRLGGLSRKVRVELYSYFDVLTGVCILTAFLQISKVLTEDVGQISWKRALDALDVRIGLCSHPEIESLRYWRGIIGKVHADFQTNLPGSGPSQILSSALLVDGRTEDSDFPNLLPYAAREPYGL